MGKAYNDKLLVFNPKIERTTKANWKTTGQEDKCKGH
jgi:hypothetical protein